MSLEVIDAVLGKPFRRVRALLRVPRAGRYRLLLQNEASFLTVKVAIRGLEAPLEVESSAGVLVTSQWVTLDPEAPRLVVLE